MKIALFDISIFVNMQILFQSAGAMAGEPVVSQLKPGAGALLAIH